MKSKIIKLLVLLVVISGVFFTYTYYLEASKLATSPEIKFYGNVETRQVNLAFRVNGKVEDILVQEGDQVKKGQLLAKLEPYPYDINAKLATTEVEIQSNQLAKLESGYQDKEITQAKAQVDGRQATVTNLQISLNRIETLKKEDIVPQQQVDDLVARLNEAKAALKAAQDQFSLLSSGFRSEDIAAQQLALKLAGLRKEQADIALADTSLFSPLDGIVVSRLIEEGSIVGAAQTVLTLTLNKPTWIRAYINQPKLAHLQYGSEVNISIDANPKQQYKGHIAFISPNAEFTPRSVETAEVRNDLVFRVRILADDPDNIFRQGMPVTIISQANQAISQESKEYGWINSFLLNLRKTILAIF